jgi:hypothetical protein
VLSLLSGPSPSSWFLFPPHSSLSHHSLKWEIHNLKEEREEVKHQEVDANQVLLLKRKKLNKVFLAMVRISFSSFWLFLIPLSPQFVRNIVWIIASSVMDTMVLSENVKIAKPKIISL